jgi:hypothetical protein
LYDLIVKELKELLIFFIDLVCLDTQRVKLVPKIAYFPVYPDDEEIPIEKPNEKPVEISYTEPPKIHCKTGKCYSTNECYLQHGKKEFALCSLPDGGRGVCCIIEEKKPPINGIVLAKFSIK